MKTDVKPIRIQLLKEQDLSNLDIFLSVITPVRDTQDQFDDSLCLDDNLCQIKDYLQTRDFSSEIIIVDKSNYDRTVEIMKNRDCYLYEFKEQRATKVKRSIQSLGHGFSIARSMLRARGKYILCIDEDASTSISGVEKLWPYIHNGANIVIVSAKIQDKTKIQVKDRPRQSSLKVKLLQSITKSMARFMDIDEICHWQYILKHWQCTLKLFDQKSAKSIAGAQKLYDHAFEIEQLYLAKAMGFSIKPLGGYLVPGYELQNLSGYIQLLCDLLKILYIHRGLKLSQS